MGWKKEEALPTKMRSSVVFFLAFLTAVVNAHFELQFPPPRGPTVDDKENLFCGSSSLSKKISPLLSPL